MQPVHLYPATSDASGGEKTSTPVKLNQHRPSFNVTVSTQVSGTVTYHLEYSTNRDLSSWTALPSGSSLTAGTLINFTFPARAVRVRQSAGTGLVNLDVLQTG